MVCPVCNEVLDSANKMARHMYATKHCLPKCPLCDTHIVGRAFKESLQKVIDGERKKLARQSIRRERERFDAPTALSGEASLFSPEAYMRAPGSSLSESPRRPIVIDTAAHRHLQQCPGFHVYEKNSFTQVRFSESGVRSGSSPHRHLPGRADDSEDEQVEKEKYLCLDCQNRFTTWTKITNHFGSTNHTLPICVHCRQSLRCFGPLRPQKHEEAFEHSGFLGCYYCRSDYQIDSQDVQCMYTSPRNKFTGFTQLQYACVCGLVFVHPLLLADHLISVHKVAFIGSGDDGYYCKTCDLRLSTMSEMRRHIRFVVPFTAGEESETPVLALSEDENSGLMQGESSWLHLSFSSLTAVSSLDAVSSPAAICAPATSGIQDSFDPRTQPQYNHDVVVPFFDPAPFLKHRPLSLACLEEMARQASSHSLGDSKNPAASAAPFAAPATSAKDTVDPYFVVMYQCRECLYLFSGWDKMVAHLQGTGHCESYCATCRRVVPPVEQPYAPRPRSSSVGAGAAASSAPTILNEGASYQEHLFNEHNLLGDCASPESLEVFIDCNTTHEPDHVDPPLECFIPFGTRASHASANPTPVVMMPGTRDQQPRLCFQCPASRKGCYQVFLYYGDLVEHFLSTGHGDRGGTDLRESSQGATGATARPAPTPRYARLPMIEYRKRFTNAQLVSHFGFLTCIYCERPFPANRLQMHIALCPAHWQMLAQQSSGR